MSKILIKVLLEPTAKCFMILGHKMDVGMVGSFSIRTSDCRMDGLAGEKAPMLPEVLKGATNGATNAFHLSRFGLTI